MERKNLLKTVAILVLLTFGINFLANSFYWYSSIWWFDMPMHFLGGSWVGLLGLYLFFSETISLRAIFKILLFVLLIGVGWEVFEILFNNIVAQNPFNMLDTTSDIFFDLSGGLCAILYICKKQQLQQPE